MSELPRIGEWAWEIGGRLGIYNNEWETDGSKSADYGEDPNCWIVVHGYSHKGQFPTHEAATTFVREVLLPSVST